MYYFIKHTCIWTYNYSIFPCVDSIGSIILSHRTLQNLYYGVLGYNTLCSVGLKLGRNGIWKCSGVIVVVHGVMQVQWCNECVVV